jgi:uncharacterized delta-60 repeat protein
VQSDDRIVICGLAAKSVSSGGTADYDGYIARFNADGSRDWTLAGGAGVIRTDSATGQNNGLVPRVFVGATGKIWAVKGSLAYPTPAPQLLRYTSAGVLDTSFSGDGIADVALPSGYSAVSFTDIAPDSTDRAVVSVYGRQTNGTDGSFVRRITAAGAIDNTFGASGTLALGTDRPGNILSDSTGRLYVHIGNASGMRISRFTSAGQVDGTYGSSGSVAVPTVPSAGISFRPIALSSSGQIAIARKLDSTDFPNAVAVTMITPAGALDTSFGTQGTNYFSINRPAGAPAAVRFTANGTVTTIGYCDPAGGQPSAMIYSVRLTTSAVPATASVSGRVFNDLNRNGRLDAGEPPLAQRTVYLDQNGNGQLDTGERSVVTNTTGDYSISALRAGFYRVAQVVPADWIRTTPAIEQKPTYLWPGQAQVNDGLGSYYNDTTPPSVVSMTFNVAPQPSIIITFSEDVSPSIQANDFEAWTNALAVPFVHAVTSLAGQPTTVRLTLSTPLPDGNYFASVRGYAIYDTSGNILGSPTYLNFYILAGDANRDRTVNFDDLLVLAANYNATGRTFTQGDFNYDGTVNFDDLLILASRYNTSLPAAAVPLGILAGGGPGGAGPVGDDDAPPRGLSDVLA